MTENPLSPERQKELDDLIRSFPNKKSELPTERLEPKEAKAIIQYITYLENFKQSSKDQIPMEFDKHDLDVGLIKLVGLSANLGLKNK